jgi:biotin synthase-related radical SAM superfamily protein
MAFKALFLAHAPDGEPEKHRCVIDTPQHFKLFVVVVKAQEQAIEVSKQVVEEEGVQSILLCPGFTHGDIAEISEAVGKNVGIFVARGDGPSNRIAMEVMTSEGWFSERGRD